MGALHEHQLAGLLGGRSVKRSVSDGSTIRKELGALIYRENADLVLGYLGLDPDLPAEWATVDRCLTWLNDRRIFLVEIRNDSLLRLRESDADRRFFVRWLLANDNGHYATGPTLHAALVAACQAVQEAS